MYNDELKGSLNDIDALGWEFILLFRENSWIFKRKKITHSTNCHI